jgi:predicted nucleotide-binding protein
VFIVHGHDHQLLRDIELWLRQAVPAAEPVVLVDQPNLGQTVIEKLEANV